MNKYIDKMDEIERMARIDKANGNVISKESVFNILDFIAGMEEEEILDFQMEEIESYAILSIVVMNGLRNVTYAELLNKYPINVLGEPFIVDFKGKDLIDMEKEFLEKYPNSTIQDFMVNSYELTKNINADYLVEQMIKLGSGL